MKQHFSVPSLAATHTRIAEPPMKNGGQSTQSAKAAGATRGSGSASMPRATAGQRGLRTITTAPAGTTRALTEAALQQSNRATMGVRLARLDRASLQRLEPTMQAYRAYAKQPNSLKMASTPGRAWNLSHIANATKIGRRTPRSHVTCVRKLLNLNIQDGDTMGFQKARFRPAGAFLLLWIF